ncbi:MAG: glycosyltransferase family 4 protein [Ignavibacteriae bacterium]|nr:glycosyltransferase family 4 protein [Ignavibacteriota bacterium]
MKVIYIGLYNTSEILSGPEKVSKRIFEEYSKVDKTLFIHYFQDGNKYGYLKKLFGYEKTGEVNGSEVLKLGIFRMLLEIIKLKPRYLHIVCFSRFAIFLYLVKIFLRVRIYYTINGIIRHENKYYNKESVFTVIKNIVAENIVIYSSDRIFYLSEYSRGILSLYYSLDKERLSVTQNGLDNCFLEQKSQGYSNKELNSIVFIGSINRKEKGFDFLIDALSLLDDYIKLYIIDNSSNNSFYLNLKNIQVISINKMSPNEMIVFLNDKNIIVSTSEYDPFNISILESVSCGLYPILTKQTGLSELIESYFPSSVIYYGDNVSLISCIKEILKRPNQYGRFNNFTRFSWGNILKDYYLHHYD